MKKRFLILTVLIAILPMCGLAKTNYQVKDEININEDYKSALFLLGQTVDVLEDTNVDGISFVGSSNLQFEGTTEHLVSASNDLRIRGKVLKDAFLIANKISLYGELNRDLYGAASSIYLSNKIKGNVKLYATSIKLENIVINKNVNLCAENIELGENVTILGTLQYNDNAIIEGLKEAKIDKIKTYKLTVGEVSLSEQLMNVLTSILNYILIGIILLYLMPKLFDKLDFDITYIGIGSLVLLLVPFIIVFMLLTPFAFSLGLILLVFFIVISYISSIITAFVLGNYINKNMLYNKDSKYISLIIGITAIKLLSLIPILGGLISVGAMLYGMGYMFSKLKKLKK